MTREEQLRQILEQADDKLNNAFQLRLQLSAQAGENAGQAFGDMFANVLTVFAGAVSHLSHEERIQAFNTMREIASDVFDYIESLMNETVQ